MNKKENPLAGIVLENGQLAEDYVNGLPEDEREVTTIAIQNWAYNYGHLKDIFPLNEREIEEQRQKVLSIRKEYEDRIRRFNLRTLLLFPFSFVAETLCVMFLPFICLFSKTKAKNGRFRLLPCIPIFLLLSPIIAIFKIVSDWDEIKNGIKDGTRDEAGNFVDYE